jgi:hypothetical protein
MSRQVKLFIYGIVFLYAIASNIEVDDYSDSKSPVVSKPSNSSIVGNSNNNDNVKSTVEDDSGSGSVINHPRPINGFSPYDSYFGRGVYNNSVSNYVEIDNQTFNDAVVLLVNAYDDRKIRNEYVRKRTKFKMTGVPDGVYYIRMMSGNNWNPNIKVGPLTGGFSKNRSISGNSNPNDWMKIGTTYADSDGRYYEGFSQTLHEVVGGNVEKESLTANEFAN